ncbi:hypothetical protein ABMA28_003474 [Loxostege sticticalis]|uniref:BED-type domain-containing protein n=1 Tax=Loxostege sticticalis TaxID=481309 RepID=A0ABD0SW70_LOXSC
MNSQRKRSAIWNHFDVLDQKKSKCSYWGQVLSVSNGNVGNLNRHLKTKHPTVPLIAERQTTEPQTNADGTEAPQLPIPTTSTSAIPPAPALHRPQLTMRDFTTNAKPLTPRRSEMLDEQLIKMIAKEFHPLHIVEEVEFKKFVNMLCPGYSLPTRKTLSESILTKMFEKTYANVQLKLSASVAVCLTIDGWTSIVNDSFVAITAHFITTTEKDIKLESVLITCIEYTDRHTSTNLCNFIKAAILEWGIEDKITAVASDNAANVTAALREGEWRHIPCFAHTLNLVVKEALTHISATVVKVKAIVEYFKRSSHAQQQLLTLQKQMNIEPLKLKQDVATRWNSTFLMLSRIVQIKNSVIAAIALLRSDLTLTDHDWSIIEAAIPILEIFYQVTEEISTKKHVSLSKVIPLCRIIFNSLRSRSQQNDIPEIIDMLGTLTREFERRTLGQDTLIATILDPRFKNKGFRNPRNSERVINTLKSKIANTNRQAVPASQTPAPVPTTSTTQSSIWDEFDQEISQMTPDYAVAAGIVEIDRYIQEKLLDRKSNPLIWWHERKLVYPLLYKYAIKRLHLIATSVPCERIFSKAGYTLNERRTRLRTKKLSQLLFINSNTD